MWVSESFRSFLTWRLPPFDQECHFGIADANYGKGKRTGEGYGIFISGDDNHKKPITLTEYTSNKTLHIPNPTLGLLNLSTFEQMKLFWEQQKIDTIHTVVVSKLIKLKFGNHE